MSTYVILTITFFFSLGLALFVATVQFCRIVLRYPSTIQFWQKHGGIIVAVAGCWFAAYGSFILLGTGPNNSDGYPSPQLSPYKLPWKAGVTRFVAQGNRSFVSHRDAHLYAFDFWMPIGTEVLASRGGKVIKIEDSHDGIGLLSNYVQIEHDDGTTAIYAHIKKLGSMVKIGDEIKQGQLIAYSGMVGQTLFPHLHFVVMGVDGKDSIPISFVELSSGAPLAGRFYKSGNIDLDRKT